MADQRCPMCGKTNPAEAEVCEFCQAQLSMLRSPAPQESDGIDWLESLRRSQPSAGAGEAEEPPQTEPEGETAEGDVPDWLARIRLRNKEENGGFGSEGSAPSRLDGLLNKPLEGWAEEGDGVIRPAARPQPEEQAHRPVDASAEIQKPYLRSAASGEDAAWLRSLAAWNSLADYAPGQQMGSSPEQEASSEAGTLPVEDTTSETGDVNDEMPEWMRALLDESSIEPAVNPEDTTSELARGVAEPPSSLSPTREDMPEWMQALHNNAPPPPADESTPLDEEPVAPMPAEDGFEITADTPEWMRVLHDQPVEPIPTASGTEDNLPVPSTELPPEANEQPAWLTGMRAAEGPAAPAAAPSSAEEVPAWLSSTGAPISTELPATAVGNEVPDWLKGVMPVAEPPAVQPASDQLPDWLAGIKSHIPEEGTSFTPPFDIEKPSQIDLPEPEPTSFIQEELPDWLTPFSTDEDTTPEGTPLPDLAKADLPAWIEALRPAETGSVAPLLTTETTGPLAGLSGILPAEGVAAQYRHLPAYAMKLKAGEQQQNNASLLENLVSGKGQPKQASTAGSALPVRLLRLFIAILLALAVLVPLLLKPSTGTLPVPPAVSDFYSQVSQLTTGAPVLLAVDYEAGYSGEMRFASNSVIEQLAIHQARLTLISTVPSGPVLAEDLLATSLDDLSIHYNQPDVSYLLNDRVVNLGYLPGGLASLQELAVRPQQAARYGLRAALDGKQTWSHPALDGITTLADYSLVIVITDQVDTGKGWIEQVQPALGKTPMLLITSAQAAPMLQPYLDSGQLKAMIAGMPGGMAFQQLAMPANVFYTPWAAYRYSTLLVIILMLTGIIVGVLPRSKVRKED